MPSQYQISPWGATQSYQQYDVVNGLLIGSTTHPTSSHLYATQASIGQNPSGIFLYPVTSIVSANDIATVYFNQTGSTPVVAPGSVVAITGTASNNYTGMVIGGGSGYLSFVNPGFADSAGAAGGVVMRNPCWTSGWFFVPGYDGTAVPTENEAIATQLGNGYTQRQSQGLNTFNQTPTLGYQGINGRMMKAIVNAVQQSEGVWPFEILVTDPYLNNQPKQKFTAEAVDVKPASFGRYSVQVQLKRVFDV